MKWIFAAIVATLVACAAMLAPAQTTVPLNPAATPPSNNAASFPNNPAADVPPSARPATSGAPPWSVTGPSLLNNGANSATASSGPATFPNLSDGMRNGNNALAINPPGGAYGDFNTPGGANTNTLPAPVAGGNAIWPSGNPSSSFTSGAAAPAATAPIGCLDPAERAACLGAGGLAQ